MKKIIILAVIFAALSLASCKKYLDVEPKQTLADNLVVTNLPGLQSVVTAAFSQMQSGNLYGGGIIANTELWADYLKTNAISDFSLSQFKSHQFNIYNSEAGGMWGDGYHAILIANTGLKYLPNFASQNQSEVSTLMGECYFVRAIMHYELVREFAQPSGYTSDDSHLGIPIRLTPPATPADGQNTPRSTVAQVYAQVVADLMRADSLLPSTLSAGTFVSKSTAEAFLTKVYFSQNKFLQAKTYADKVIASGYTLNDSANIGTIYTLLGNQTTPETIFEIINFSNDIDNGSLNGRFSVPPFGSTVPLYMLSDSFVSLLKADTAGAAVSGETDVRLRLYKKSFGLYFCKKYDATYSNVNVVRLAEILLTRAECEAQLGDNGDAVTDLNTVRARAGLLPQTGGGALLANIRRERAVELGMEGDHYFEVKRTKGTFYCQVGNFNWNDPTMVYPIPAQEVNENKNMVQNPGY